MIEPIWWLNDAYWHHIYHSFILFFSLQQDLHWILRGFWFHQSIHSSSHLAYLILGLKCTVSHGTVAKLVQPYHQSCEHCGAGFDSCWWYFETKSDLFPYPANDQFKFDFSFHILKMCLWSSLALPVVPLFLWDPRWLVVCMSTAWVALN